MGARTSGGPRRMRRRLPVVVLLAVILLGGAGLWLGLNHGSPPAATVPAAAHNPPAPRLSDRPVPSDPSLATMPSGQVPAAVLADVPQLPAHLAPVGLGGTSRFGDGVTTRLVAIKAVTATARTRGEISGPALAVAVEMTNGGASPVSLDTVAVNAYGGPDATPAVPMLDGSTQPLRGTLGAGKSMTATYVFAVPIAQRDSVTVTVSHGAGRDAATAVFSGRVS